MKKMDAQRPLLWDDINHCRAAPVFSRLLLQYAFHSFFFFFFSVTLGGASGSLSHMAEMASRAVGNRFHTTDMALNFFSAERIIFCPTFFFFFLGRAGCLSLSCLKKTTASLRYQRMRELGLLLLLLQDEHEESTEEEEEKQSSWSEEEESSEDEPVQPAAPVKKLPSISPLKNCSRCSQEDDVRCQKICRCSADDEESGEQDHGKELSENTESFYQQGCSAEQVGKEGRSQRKKSETGGGRRRQGVTLLAWDLQPLETKGILQVASMRFLSSARVVGRQSQTARRDRKREKEKIRKMELLPQLSAFCSRALLVLGEEIEDASFLADASRLSALSRVLGPAQAAALSEERFAQGRCGWLMCSGTVRKEEAGRGGLRFDEERGELVEDARAGLFCSTACRGKSEEWTLESGSCAAALANEAGGNRDGGGESGADVERATG